MLNPNIHIRNYPLTDNSSRIVVKGRISGSRTEALGTSGLRISVHLQRFSTSSRGLDGHRLRAVARQVKPFADWVFVISVDNERTATTVAFMCINWQTTRTAWKKGTRMTKKSAWDQDDALGQEGERRLTNGFCTLHQCYRNSENVFDSDSDSRNFWLLILILIPTV